MAGTSIGSKKSVAKILAKDPDHFKKIGQKGGSRSKRHLSHEEAVRLGRMGGKNGKRGKAKKSLTWNDVYGIDYGFAPDPDQHTWAVAQPHTKKRTLIDKILRRK